MQVTNTGASNSIAGSFLSHAATSTSWSRLIHAMSSLCSVCVRSVAEPCFAVNASRTFCDTVPPESVFARGDLSLVLVAELAVAAPGLHAVHQHDQRVEHLLGARRAAGDVDVDRDHLIGARHRV